MILHSTRSFFRTLTASTAILPALCAAAAAAPLTTPVVHATSAPLPTLRVPHTDVPPRLDASQDDPAWKSAAKIGALASSIVTDGPTPHVPPTQVLALWDKDYLYVRFVCADHDIFTPYTKRDAPHYQGDVAEIFLDPVGDSRLYYEMELSPHGGILDQYIALTATPRFTPDGRLTDEIATRDFWPNPGWNCERLRTATRTLSNQGRTIGWIAEFALPAKAMLQRLGRSEFAPGTLRANFLRYDYPPGKDGKTRDFVAQNWSPVMLGCPHISPDRMGFLKLENSQ